MTSNQKTKDLPKIERPREKLIQYGPERLSNSELILEIIAADGFILVGQRKS
mgnify:CR=1